MHLYKLFLLNFLKLFFIVNLALLTSSCSPSNLYKFSNTGHPISQLQNLPYKNSSDSTQFLKHLPAPLISSQNLDLTLKRDKPIRLKGQKHNLEHPTDFTYKPPFVKPQKQRSVKISEAKRPSDPPWGALFLAILAVLILVLAVLTGLVFLFIFIVNSWGWVIFSASLLALALLLRLAYLFIYKVIGNLIFWLEGLFFGSGVR